VLAQEGRLRRGLHALGKHRHAGVAAGFDDGAGDCRIARITGDAADKRAVDLQRVEGMQPQRLGEE
jgi:hypothetical protein